MISQALAVQPPIKSARPKGVQVRQFERSTVIAGSFADAREVLSTWGVHRTAGLMVLPAGLNVEEGCSYRLKLAYLPGLEQPVTVESVVSGQTQWGFTYRAGDGHLETGWQRFVLTEVADGVRFVITTRSEPAWAVTKLFSGPVNLAQHLFIGRYLRSLGRAMNRRASRGEPSG